MRTFIKGRLEGTRGNRPGDREIYFDPTQILILADWSYDGVAITLRNGYVTYIDGISACDVMKLMTDTEIAPAVVEAAAA
jgi:hypothetical protein